MRSMICTAGFMGFDVNCKYDLQCTVSYKAWCLCVVNMERILKPWWAPDSPWLLIWTQVFLVSTYTLDQSPGPMTIISYGTIYVSLAKAKALYHLISKCFHKKDKTTFDWEIRDALVQGYPTDRLPLTRDGDHCRTTIRLWLAPILFQQKVSRRSFGIDLEWAFRSITLQSSFLLPPFLV